MVDSVKLSGILSRGREYHVWFCGNCSTIYRDQATADLCCKPHTCKCGKEILHSNICRECRNKEDNDKTQRLYDKAKKVQWEDYSGSLMLYCEQDHEYHPDMDSILDEWPEAEWAWGTTKCHLHIDAHEVIEARLLEEEWYDDASREIPKDLSALQAALDAVCSQIPPAYEADFSTVVEFPERDTEEE